MNHHDEEALQAWLDGAGTEAERKAFRLKAEADPELAAALVLEQRIAGSLRSQFEPSASALAWPKAAVPASLFTNHRWKIAAALIATGFVVAVWLGRDFFITPKGRPPIQVQEVASWWETPPGEIIPVPPLEVHPASESLWGNRLAAEWKQSCVAVCVPVCGPIPTLNQVVKRCADTKVDLSPGCGFRLDSEKPSSASMEVVASSPHPNRPTVLLCSSGLDRRILLVAGLTHDPKPQVAQKAGFQVWRRSLSGYVFYECGKGEEPRVLPHLKPPAP